MALFLPSASSLHYHGHQHHPQPDQRFLFFRSTPILGHHFHQINKVNPRRSVILSEQARVNNALSPSTSSEYHHPQVSLPRAVTHLCQTQQFNKALSLIQEELERSYRTTSIDKAIEVLIQACAEHEHIEIGRKLDQLVSVHFPHDMVLATRLFMMYYLCGSPDEAGFVFNRLETKNLFVWNAMISTYTRNGFYPDAILTFCELMSATEMKPDNFTLPSVIKACGGAAEAGAGGAVHGLAIKFTLVHDVFVGNALIAMYLKFRYEEEAIEVFENLTHRNLVSWNTMIRGYSAKGSLKESLNLFVHMLEKGLAPDVATTVTLLPVCAAEGDVDSGMIIHSLAVKLGLVQEQNVVNSLMDMYGKCGFSSDAETLFEKSKYKNVVSWNCLIANRSRNESTADAALNVIRRMNDEGGSNLVDEVTILNILLACVGSSELMSLKELHGYSIRRRFNYHELVINALVTAYAKCGLLDYADSIFELVEYSNKTINLWNAIVSGYAQNGDLERALDLFLEMIFSGLRPDCYTLGQLLGVCAQLRRLDSGREIHCFVLRNGMEMNSFFGISLLSFYFSCEKLYIAWALFERMNERTLVHWNTMICGYLQNESPKEAIILFHQMVSDGIRPYEVALTSLLSACSKVLALHLGKEGHCFALKANLMEDSILSSAIIDMYAKCGCIEQSWMVFGTVKKKELASFNAMIAGLGIHGHGKWAVELFQELERSQLKPDHCTFVNLLMACSHAGLVEEGVKQLKRMETIYNIQPRLEHYSCVVDMLGRAGELQQAIELVDTMPFEPDVKVWSSLASSGGLHCELSIGREIAQKLTELEPNSANSYVLQSNLMAQSDKWGDVRIIRRRMKEMGLKKSAGCSWIDIGGGASSGRNSAGCITIFHRGGGSKRQHRNVDLKRNTSSTGIVERIEHDPNRSSKIALVRWVEGVEPNKPIQKFTPQKKSTVDFIAATVSSQFPLGCLSPRLMTSSAALTATEGSKGIKMVKFSSLQDVFSFGLSSGGTKQFSSLNFPRITVAGAKPGFFVAQPRGELEAEEEKEFSLSEIKKWKRDSVLWAHRSKRKEAFSWQSIVRNDISLGFVRDDENVEYMLQMGDGSSHVKQTGRRSKKYGKDCAPISYILASNELEAGSMVMNCNSSKSSKKHCSVFYTWKCQTTFNPLKCFVNNIEDLDT